MTKFRLRLAELKAQTRYGKVSFTGPAKDEFADSVLQEACGDHMDYGSLFSYLFRRFGYPNMGWDDFKELACYHLTTPNPDLILRAVPYVGGSTSIHFSFYAPLELVRATKDWGQRFRAAWEQRALNWAERKGLPEWMNEWVLFVKEEMAHNGPCPGWRETVPWMKWLAVGVEKMENGGRRAIIERAAGFSEELHAQYRQIEPYPAYCERSSNWHEWEADDPLKPLAEAAVVALQDLRRPVRVRDCAIDAFGRADERYQHAVKEPEVAGYPSGDLGNKAPKEFAALHELVLRLGKDSARRGIRKVIAGATRASRGPRP